MFNVVYSSPTAVHMTATGQECSTTTVVGTVSGSCKQPLPRTCACIAPAPGVFACKQQRQVSFRMQVSSAANQVMRSSNHFTIGWWVVLANSMVLVCAAILAVRYFGSTEEQLDSVAT